MNRTLSWIMLVILSGVIFAGITTVINSPARTDAQKPAVQTASAPQDSSSVAPTSSPIQKPDQEQASEAPRDDLKKMGEEFKIGDFSFNIVKAVAAGGITRSYEQPLKAAAGAVFVIVDYVIRNDGTESEQMWISGFKIEDAKGRKFSTSSEVETEVEMHSKNRDDMFVKELHPGIARTLRAAFEIPKDLLAQPLVLIIPERGLFSTGSVKVDLVVTRLEKKKKNH